MKAVVQRVTEAAVFVDGAVVGSIGPGLLVLVGVGPSDTPADATTIAAKLVGLRVFGDSEDRMNLSVADIGGSVLVVSQFTLLGDVRNGRRPSFVGAAEPAIAEPLVQVVADSIAEAGVPTETGSFGAKMSVKLTNDGPVTILIESAGGVIR